MTVLGSPSLISLVVFVQHCVEVEVAVLGSPSLMVSADVMQHSVCSSIARMAGYIVVGNGSGLEEEKDLVSQPYPYLQPRENTITESHSRADNLDLAF